MSIERKIIPVLGSTFRVNAGAMAPGQSIKTFSSSGAIGINAGATSNVYTVTAAKTLYITDILLSTDSAAAFLVQIKAGATVIFEKYISTTADFNMTGIESQDGVAGGVLLTVVWPTVAGKNGTFKISGFEQ